MLTRDGLLLFGTRIARLFGYGFLSVVLVLQLAAVCFGALVAKRPARMNIWVAPSYQTVSPNACSSSRPVAPSTRGSDPPNRTARSAKHPPGACSS